MGGSLVYVLYCFLSWCVQIGPQNNSKDCVGNAVYLLINLIVYTLGAAAFEESIFILPLHLTWLTLFPTGHFWGKNTAESISYLRKPWRGYVSHDVMQVVNNFLLWRKASDWSMTSLYTSTGTNTMRYTSMVHTYMGNTYMRYTFMLHISTEVCISIYNKSSSLLYTSTSGRSIEPKKSFYSLYCYFL